MADSTAPIQQTDTFDYSFSSPFFVLGNITFYPSAAFNQSMTFVNVPGYSNAGAEHQIYVSDISLVYEGKEMRSVC